MIRKAGTILLVLVILLMTSTFVFAKGSKQTSGSSGTSGTSAPQQTTLRLMAYNSESSRATYLKYLAEKLPDIKVVFEFVNVDNFNNVLNAQLQAGQGPDIIEVGGETKLLAKAGYLMELTNQPFISAYADAGFPAYTLNNKIYATPLQSWYEGIFYNKKIFRNNNISIPKTLDQFIQIHKTLSAKGIKPQTMGAQSWEPMMKQSIGVVLNEFYAKPASRGFDEKFDRGEAKLVDTWLPAVTAWSRMISEGCLTRDMLGLSYDQALNEFATGKAAMWECGPWGVNTILETGLPLSDLGMFPIPGLTEGPGWLVGGPGSGLAINANSKNKEAALKVLALTATPEAQIALIKDNAGSSFVKGVSVDLGPIYADCAEAFKMGNVYAPWVAVWTAGNPIVEGYGKSLQEVLAGRKNVRQALIDADTINDKMRAALK